MRAWEAWDAIAMSGHMEPLKLARTLFKEYYSRLNASRLYEPPHIELREFAFQLFNSKGMERHRAFKSLSELLSFLRSKVPRHVYFSSAYFEVPNVPDMSCKGWLGADLVFDIDADHIDTPCKVLHDEWTCMNCGASGKGMVPEACPQCGSRSINATTMVCDECIRAARDEVVKLIEDYLVPDFGLKLDDMLIAFSGHRGFHVHVRSRDYMRLNSNQRREIVDYLKGIGLRLEIPAYVKARKATSLLGPGVKAPGWYGRITRGLVGLLRDIEFVSKITNIPYDVLVEECSSIISDLLSEPPRWGRVLQLFGDSLNKLIEHVVDMVSCKIDEKVTIDVHRLIRLPGTLNGKTGFLVAVLDFDEVEKFTMCERYAPFSNVEALVEAARSVPRVRIMGYNIVIPKGRPTRLPVSIALYLALRDYVKILKVV